MDSSIASLTNSFSLVPPAAIPSIIDCILLTSTTLSPSHLLASLLTSFPDLNPSEPNRAVVAYVSAICHLIKKSEDEGKELLREFVGRVFVPLLKVVRSNDYDLLNQIEELFIDAVSCMQSWDVMEECLIPYCLRSVGLAVGMVQNDELSIYKWSSEDSLEIDGTLSVPIACRMLTSLANSSLRVWREARNSKQKLEHFPNLMWDLSSLAFGMLMRSLEDRSVCIRLLLPTVFKSFKEFTSTEVMVNGSLRTLSRTCFAKRLWECCTSLLSLGHKERLDVYNILSLYFSSFYYVEQHESSTFENTDERFDFRNKEEFWMEIRRGLADKDASLRKLALYILKISLHNYSSIESNGHCSSDGSEITTDAKNDQTISCNGTSSRGNMTKRGKYAEQEAKSLGVGEVCLSGDHCLNSQERWKVFLLLYEMLEEYGTHLVEAAWNHQVFLLFRSRPLDNDLNNITCGVYQVQMKTVEGIFCWLAVLWERGFFHENPQVRCLIMESFLGINWETYGNFAQKVPRSFVLGPLLLGLNDVVHHRDFGVKGIYTSRTIQGAAKFFHSISCKMSFSEHMEFVWSLASVARHESFGRAGLMAFAFCIASAACRSDVPSVREDYCNVDGSYEVEHVESAKKFSLPSIAADLLDVFGIFIERSKQHFNPNYRLQVCEQVIKAASSMINIGNVSLNIVLHFLSAVPREFTDCAGPLREMVQQWLTGINNEVKAFGSFDTRSHVLNNLVSFPTSFVKHKQSLDDSISFDDGDMDAWEVEAQRWARVLFLVVTEAQLLEPIYMLLLNHCSNLCKSDHRMDWIPAKLLILIQSLVEELQIEWRKFSSCSETKPGRECIRTKKMDHYSPLVTSANYENFVRPFLHIMVELVCFSKLLSPIFWSTSMVKADTQLPCSVKCKLGGPSQRRLASLATTSVLQAILSLRTVACISSWCSQLGTDDYLNSSLIFLWDFSWKVIHSQTYNTETGAELCLAGYEALTSVFKAWSMISSPLFFDFIKAHNKSLFPNGEDKPLLDHLVLCFLHSINDLLANGVLTRSRRAVLMNWKWLCLDSLLSIPYNAIKNVVHIRNTHSFLSDSTLRCAFSDIVESLENAGENSALFILRSVRLVVGLLCFVNIRPGISSLLGVNCQMMLQLVHSSWLLHVSCNKRRVAPIAALLSAVLHQSVFSDLQMHESNGSQQGPLKWFIERILDEGAKSPRTIRLAALHLTRLWFSHPKTVKYYIKELKLLSLYGSVAFDEDFEAELCENHEARTEVSLLAQSPDCELTEVFINTELYARVSVAVLFYNLANLANTRKSQESEDSLAALHCGKLFLLELLDSAVNDNDLAKELYKKYSAVHRRKVRAWQMICILSHFVEEDIVKEVTSNLHICLYRNNLPAVRQYLETFAILVYLKFPALAEEQLIPIFYDYTMRPQALSSYVFIAANIIVHARELPVQIKHLNELLPPIIPFLTSHHHSLRAFTQLLVHYVLCKLWPASKPNSPKQAPLEARCFEDLKSYLAENIDCMRLRTSMEVFLDAFDPDTSATPAGVFNARNEGSDFECVPISLMEQVIIFLNDVRDDLRNSMSKDAMIIKNERLTVPDFGQDTTKELDVTTERLSSPNTKDLSLDFQKKITIYQHERQASNCNTDCFLGNAEFSNLLSEMEKEDELLNQVILSRNQAMERIRESQQQFILVASLLDRIPNLAGLARTCEIFKATGLVVANASIMQDKQFQLISVTAEKWVPIIEVPVCNMKVFLEKKRQEGFSILGLEQTANSTPLDQYAFPNKTVLVLGREKEGIPVDIIHVLDACIEIPQLGIIRSLNVHVSGAIALWEYTRQRRLEQL